MRLDVVVVTYNSADQLAQALGPLPEWARVVVVDNASTDGSAAVARELGVDVLANPVNAGFGTGANLGVACGSEDLVLLLNPDARVSEAVLEQLCRRMEDDPELAVVSPRLVRPDGSEQRVWWPFPSASGAWREALGLHKALAGAPDVGLRDRRLLPRTSFGVRGAGRVRPALLALQRGDRLLPPGPASGLEGRARRPTSRPGTSVGPAAAAWVVSSSSTSNVAATTSWPSTTGRPRWSPIGSPT